MPDITVSSDIHSFMQSADDAAARTDLGLGSADSVTHDAITLTTEATAPEFIGELRGAVIFAAQAGEALSKGDVVYVSGVSGNTPVVSKADKSNAVKMPAFGLANRNASINAQVEVVTMGTLSGLDTSSWSLGDTLYVNGSGVLTNVKPTGEGSLIQNLAKVQRVHESSGSVKVGGAGRTNDTPNLDEDNIFIGNASNKAVTQSMADALNNANAAVVTNQVGAPSSTPNKLGDININTTTSDVYIAVGTSSSSDWKLI